MRVKKLPLDKPDRLRMMICKIVMKEDVDAFTFDFTRTLDGDISKYCQYLSSDRWIGFQIINDELYEIVDVKGYAPHDYNTRYKKLDEFDEKKV